MYFGKRILDIAIGFIGSAFLFPIFLVIAPLIKLDSPGPVFYKSRRISNGKRVNIYKFRTMVEGAYDMRADLSAQNERNDGPFFKISQDPRITRAGRALRRLHLDEWPQFINVLKGDISLVGPRAHEPEEIAQYPKEYRHIPQVIAGLTGYSQINGASSLPFLKELQYDEWYVKNASFRLDSYIILRTIKKILEGRGE